MRGLEFALTADDIIIPAVCPVLGVPLIAGGPIRGQSPSVDRLDPKKGYTRNNVRVISYRANTIKNDATPEELEQILRYVRQEGEKVT